MRIRFGTSGWRGIIAREFTWDRVNRVVDAISVLLQRQDRMTVVAGGDCRFLSPELAQATAERMAGYGFRVTLSSVPCPTPVLSHACRKHGLGGVINFTASHNPPVYNGIKFSPYHGGPAAGETTADIEELIEKGTRPRDGSGSVETMDLRAEYMETLRGYLDGSVFHRADLKVVYDAFSGTGAGILDRMLVDLGASVRVINGVRDPLFAGRQHPEPGRKGVQDLAREVTKSGASLGIATDGDADRFGLVDENGDFVSPHDFLPLLLEYLAEVRGFRGRAVRSVTTGSLLDTVARDLQLPVTVTPVGFKYLGAEMLRGDVLLAGEESGGLSITDHVPEKDGILACLLAAEMVCSRGKGLAKQLKDLWERYGRVFVRRNDMPLDSNLKNLIRRKYFDADPTSIGGMKVVKTDRTDGCRMIMDDGSWILIRLSGTEPLARIYAQTDSSTGVQNMLRRVSEEFLGDDS